MGLKERLREAAQQAQDGLADGLAKGQDKLEQYRSGQAVSDQLQALGQAYWLQQSGRATPDQFQALLEAVTPAIREGEARTGLLPWPSVPGSTAAPAATVATDPGAAPSATPSGMPTAIHHEPPAE